MKIRVYPDNANEHNGIFAELEFDAVPRVGDSVIVPFEIEQEWAREVVKYSYRIDEWSQWIIAGEKSKEIDFGDAMVVTKVWWGFDYNLRKMVCWMALDSDVDVGKSYRGKDIPELTEKDIKNIKKNTAIYYEL